MTTHLIKPGPISGLSTRCAIELTKAGEKATIGTEDGIGHIDCAGCLRDLIVEMRMKEIGGDSVEALWLAGGDTGVSSKTIWSVMTGLPVGRTSVPWDPDDFGRCHRLLEEFPAWRERMPEVAVKYPEWEGLIEAWPELIALYLEELSSGKAPKLYDRMQLLTRA